MLDKHTEVIVVGFSDPITPIIDFKEYMTLEECLVFIKNKLREDDVKNNPLFEIGVYLNSSTRIFSHYRNELRIDDDFKDQIIIEHIKLKFLFS